MEKEVKKDDDSQEQTATPTSTPVSTPAASASSSTRKRKSVRDRDRSKQTKEADKKQTTSGAGASAGASDEADVPKKKQKLEGTEQSVCAERLDITHLVSHRLVLSGPPFRSRVTWRRSRWKLSFPRSSNRIWWTTTTRSTDRSIWWKYLAATQCPPSWMITSQPRMRSSTHRGESGALRD